VTPEDQAPFAVEVERRSPGLFLVRLVGELDMATGSDLSETLRRVGGSPPFQVVVDLSQLTFIDSSGLNAFAASSRAVTEAGGSVVFAAPSPHVARVLEIVQLPDAMRFSASLDDALRDAAAHLPAADA
jgi:anti-anti-sigma factor